MVRSSFKQLALVAAFAVAAPVFADADPSMHEVYEAAESGHVDQAQKMITQVLKDHPTSAKAHYVAAEIYAKEGNYSLSRDELNQAEHLQPGLPFASAQSVGELKSELGAKLGGYVQQRPSPVAASSSSHGFPWGFAMVVVGVIALVMFVMNRIRNAGRYAVNGMGGMRGGPDGYGYGGYGAPPPSGGSGLMGSLASGLAVGAGVAVGEEVVEKLLDGRHERGGSFTTPIENSGGGNYNSDMGGNDFGVSDSSSWDSGSSGSDFGGGDDWS